MKDFCNLIKINLLYDKEQPILSPQELAALLIVDSNESPPIYAFFLFFMVLKSQFTTSNKKVLTNTFH